VKDTGDKENIHPEFVASTVNELANADTIFTVDTGMSCVWGARYIQATGKRKMLGSFNHGSMANAMPQAIGAALACPGRQVIALCGDGGLSMLLGDLATITQYKLPIKIIVFNNRSLGMVKLEMEVAGLPDWQTDMYDPDFALVAQAMGMKGITVREPDDVKQALKEAFMFKGPALVNIMTDPNALAMPSKIEFEQVKGMALSMTKLILNGRMDEVLDTVKSNYKHLKDLV
jgi:pyruvate dehydrogenase (quinone)